MSNETEEKKQSTTLKVEKNQTEEPRVKKFTLPQAKKKINEEEQERQNRLARCNRLIQIALDTNNCFLGVNPDSKLNNLQITITLNN